MSSYLPAFLLALLLHEMGHFLAARACHITIRELGVGWGRKIYGARFNEVDYVFRLLPIGAYVRFDVGELQERPLGQQVLVLLAGIIVNLVAASATDGTHFSTANFLLAATNILPLYQQDGWKAGMVMLRSILRRKSGLVEWTFTIAGTVMSLALIAVAIVRTVS